MVSGGRGNRGLSRRALLGLAAAGGLGPAFGTASSRSAEPFRFGLTPVFLSNDLELLAHLKGYLESRLDGAVELVNRRTYQEITALLVSAQLQGAWICGYPYVQYKADLELVATPSWHGEPL